MKPGLAIGALATLAYAILGLLVLDPHALLSVDAAIKLLQARALIDSGGHTLAINYPAALLDPGFQFFPFAPPFVFNTGHGWEGIFSSGVALFNAAWVPLGVAGLVVASALSGGVTLGIMSSLPANAPRWVLPLLLGLGTNLWFYSVLPWEHVPALALSTAAWALICKPSPHTAIAALAFGVAVVLREESLFLMPGYIAAMWVTHRDLKACILFVFVLIIPTCVLSAVDGLLFMRPPAAHVAQLFTLLAGYAAGPQGIVLRESWTLAERAQVIVQDWMLGRSGWPYAALVIALLAAAALLRRRTAAAYAVFVLAMLSVVQLIQDLVAMVPAPDFVPGLLRLSPVLIFTFVPVAPGRAESSMRRLERLMSATFLIAMLATVSFTGGAALGPRLLLPILPWLCHAACEGLWSYRPIPGSRTAIPVWALGLVLLAGSIAMQIGVTMRAYVAFNSAESRAVAMLRGAADAIIVIDSGYTMSVTEPVYLTRQVMMADSPAKAAQLSALLQRESVPAFRLVSRELTQAFDFAPYRLVAVEHFAATTIQQWALPPDIHDGKPQ